MEVRWEYLTPPDFEKLAREEALCVLPIGSLERHGDHMPFGSDGLICHDICVRAAKIENCVVFPTYWFGQVHEASCFTGTVNFDTDLLCKMLEQLLDQIASNGFKKILIISAHGGNNNFLQYFTMSQIDRDVDYLLYVGFAYGRGKFDDLHIWETDVIGHADERETSLMMAINPKSVKLEYHKFKENIVAKHDLEGLGDRIYTGLFWYDNFPQNVTGEPLAATVQKGETALEAAADDLADMIRRVKADTALDKLKKDFDTRKKNKGK